MLGAFGQEMAGFPFLSQAALSWAYLGWVVVWAALALLLATTVFRRRDL